MPDFRRAVSYLTGQIVGSSGSSGAPDYNRRLVEESPDRARVPQYTSR
jgi:hypothetical protein